MKFFQSIWYRLFVLFVVGNLILMVLVGRPDQWFFAVWVAIATFGIGPAVPNLISRRWFRVRESERVLHCVLGVGVFEWLLDHSGWNRHLAEPMRGFNGTRGGLAYLERELRATASAHGTCFVLHVVLAVMAFFVGAKRGALWILLAGVPIHLYPVLLQRSIKLRLQALLKKDTFVTS